MTGSVPPLLARTLEELFGLSADGLRPDARLEEDLALDSLALVELHGAVEDALGVRMDAEPAPRTLADLAVLIDAAVRRGQPAPRTTDLSPGAP